MEETLTSINNTSDEYAIETTIVARDNDTAGEDTMNPERVNINEDTIAINKAAIEGTTNYEDRGTKESNDAEHNGNEYMINGCDTSDLKQTQDEQSNDDENSLMSEVVPRRDSTNTGRTSILLKCRVCDLPAAKKKKDVLVCHVCKGLIHYNCTRLPIYMLFSLSKGSKKYICEECSIPTEDFIEGIELRYGKSLETSDMHMCKQGNKVNEKETGMAELESRVNELSVIVEKFDLQKITDNLKLTFEKIEKTNSSINENLAHLKKERKENTNCKHECELNEMNREKETKENEELKQELKSFKHSYELLMGTLEEKEKLINSLNISKDKQLKTMNQKDEIIRELNSEIASHKDDIGKVNVEKVKNEEMRHNMKKYDDKIIELTEKCISNATNADRKQDIISILTEQLKEANESKNKLENNLSTLISTNKAVNVSYANKCKVTATEDQENETGEPKVILLHDSMCKDINETILSKEKVNFKKTKAPTLEEMSNAIDRMEGKVDVIILQALTRDLSKFKIMEVGSKLNTLVEKAAMKAKSVVIPTVVKREDDERINMMADVINANIKYVYMNNPKVVVCDNENLRDRKFRNYDGIHLTPHGTSVLANNIKYKVAKALNIQVERKPRRPRSDLYGHNADNYGYNNNNTSSRGWNDTSGRIRNDRNVIRLDE